MAGLARRDSGHGVDKPARRARIAGPGGADQRAGLARRGPRACGPQPREAAARLWRPEPPAALPGQRVDHRALLWIAPDVDRERRCPGPQGVALAAAFCRITLMRDERSEYR